MMTISEMPLPPWPIKSLFWNQRLDSKQIRDLFIFHVVVPLSFGMALGANQTGIAFFLPWTLSILYWVLLALLAWQILHWATAGTALLLSRLRFPLTLTLLAGAIVATFVMRPYMYKYSGLFSPYLINGRTVQTVSPFEWNIDFILRHLQLWAGMIVVWVLINLIFDRLIGAPRYRPGQIAPLGSAQIQYAHGHAPTTAHQETGHVLQRSPFGLPPDTVIQALKSEDHYVRVFSSYGEKLVLMRLSDAIKEVGGAQGARVHRSYWVAKHSVERVETQGRNLTLHLQNGLAIPVSQTYKESARLAGLIT